jgi:glycosidase
VDTFNLDGLRVDAVKQVPEVATRNLVAELRETFEHGGAKLFFLGETAMGWNDCDDPCNDQNYDLISKYIGPQGLDGQFDFVLYYAASTSVFAYGDRGMTHADYWFSHGVTKYPEGSIMTPYLGSHDTPRFTTLADYGGQDAAHGRDIPSNEWTHLPSAPTRSEPYRRSRIAFSWLLGLPGAPLIYYGDEYGQWGGTDPHNRSLWLPEGALDADQSETLAYVRKLGLTRRALAPLRRGDYVSLGSTDDTLAFGRLAAPGQAAVVGLTRSATPATLTVSVSRALGLNPLSVLHDALGGPDATIAINGDLTLTVPPGGAVILAP